MKFLPLRIAYYHKQTGEKKITDLPFELSLEWNKASKSEQDAIAKLCFIAFNI